jgi:hypothetical protein
VRFTSPLTKMPSVDQVPVKTAFEMRWL